MKPYDLQKITMFIFCFFIISLTTIQSQEISIFDIARQGSLVQLQSAIKKDANIINTLSREGYAPLTLACYSGNNEVAKYLIAHVDDIDSKSSYGTPLMAATVKKNTELVRLLLQKNANPNAVDQNGSSALHFSVIFSYEEIIKLLMLAEADPTIKDNRGNSALDYARITNNKKITQLLKKQ